MNTAADHPDAAALRALANRMDRAFRLPVIGTRIGWDSILGLVPGVGDALTLAPAIYIIKTAHGKGVPAATLGRMGVNVGIDALIGTVPVFGDLFDIGWKANTRNVDLLDRHLKLTDQDRSNENRRPESRP
ncbi:DUF4112 domain-containing protein [uncultured Sulfitobacter sp.]|uniref:DUF4112 domain-containing protein n=1 Tax=uncultured Sulfitobacter sp. TaxID=191468 RepID=UPI00261D9257|nr:DUF4112 domain-containing protein [uncultured Sulfitobacter sp.]